MTKEMFVEMGLCNVDKWYDKENDFMCLRLSDMLGTDDCGILVVTTPTYQYGAASLSHPEYFEKIAEKLDSDLYLIPSSIHEILVIRKEGLRGDDLRNIIGKVNISCVKHEIRLGNNPLVYKKGSMEITLI